MHPHATAKIKAAFKEVDINADHKIDWKEIQECCSTLKVKVTEDDYEYFCKSDSSGDNRLDFNEFCAFVESRLRKVFDAIDIDKNGTLDAFEIQQCLQKFSINVSIRKIESILSGMDRNKDNVIDFEEFCDFFADLPSADLEAIASKWMNGFGVDIGVDHVPASLPPSEVPLWRFMFAGGCGGVASRTATAPLERIKILAQTTSEKGRLRILNTFSNIWHKEGIRGLFAGNGTNVIRIFPTSALVCLVYSRMIKYTPVDNEKNPSQPLWRILSGATAGVIATSATHPLDVVRARLTVQDQSFRAVGQYRGITHALRTIAAEEGMKGLFKGLSPTLLSIAPFLAIQQTFYDVIKIYATESRFSNNASTFLLCGALAGTVAQTAVHPLDVIRRTMQVHRKNNNSRTMFQSTGMAFKTLLREGGIPRIYAGLTAAYLKVVPSAAISLLVRDYLLGRIKD